MLSFQSAGYYLLLLVGVVCGAPEGLFVEDLPSPADVEVREFVGVYAAHLDSGWIKRTPFDCMLECLYSVKDLSPFCGCYEASARGGFIDQSFACSQSLPDHLLDFIPNPESCSIIDNAHPFCKGYRKKPAASSDTSKLDLGTLLFPEKLRPYLSMEYRTVTSAAAYDLLFPYMVIALVCVMFIASLNLDQTLKFLITCFVLAVAGFSVDASLFMPTVFICVAFALSRGHDNADTFSVAVVPFVFIVFSAYFATIMSHFGAAIGVGVLMVGHLVAIGVSWGKMRRASEHAILLAGLGLGILTYPAIFRALLYSKDWWISRALFLPFDMIYSVSGTPFESMVFRIANVVLPYLQLAHQMFGTALTHKDVGYARIVCGMVSMLVAYLRLAAYVAIVKPGVSINDGAHAALVGYFPRLWQDLWHLIRLLTRLRLTLAFRHCVIMLVKIVIFAGGIEMLFLSAVFYCVDLFHTPAELRVKVLSRVPDSILDSVRANCVTLYSLGNAVGSGYLTYDNGHACIRSVSHLSEATHFSRKCDPDERLLLRGYRLGPAIGEGAIADSIAYWDTDIVPFGTTLPCLPVTSQERIEQVSVYSSLHGDWVSTNTFHFGTHGGTAIDLTALFMPGDSGSPVVAGLSDGSWCDVGSFSQGPSVSAIASNYKAILLRNADVVVRVVLGRVKDATALTSMTLHAAIRARHEANKTSEIVAKHNERMAFETERARAQQLYSTSRLDLDTAGARAYDKAEFNRLEFENAKFEQQMAHAIRSNDERARLDKLRTDIASESQLRRRKVYGIEEAEAELRQLRAQVALEAEGNPEGVPSSIAGYAAVRRDILAARDAVVEKKLKGAISAAQTHPDSMASKRLRDAGIDDVALAVKQARAQPDAKIERFKGVRPNVSPEVVFDAIVGMPSQNNQIVPRDKEIGSCHSAAIPWLIAMRDLYHGAFSGRFNDISCGDKNVADVRKTVGPIFVNHAEAIRRGRIQEFAKVVAKAIKG